MSDDRKAEMAVWSPPHEPITRRTLATTLAEFAAFTAVMGLLLVLLVIGGD